MAGRDRDIAPAALPGRKGRYLEPTAPLCACRNVRPESSQTISTGLNPMNSTMNEHPTIAAMRTRPTSPPIAEPLDADWLRQLCLDAGADDVGFVEVDRPALAGERAPPPRAFPPPRSGHRFWRRMGRLK